jgi:superfamily II DNA or RNA helicase
MLIYSLYFVLLLHRAPKFYTAMSPADTYPKAEQFPGHPESAPRYTEADHLFVQQMMGSEESFCDLNTATYDERQVIGLHVLEEREQRRQHLIQLAQERLGYNPREAAEKGAEWAPSANDLETLFASPAVRKERKRAAMLDGITTFVEDYDALANSMGASLRKHQIPALHAFHDFMLHTERSEGGGKRGIFEMATGLGKTAILSKITAALKHTESLDDPIKVLILTPTNTILEQTVGRDGKRGIGKFAPHLKPGVQNQFEDYNDEEVGIMTVASFDRQMAAGTMPHFDAVIVDEVHTVMGEKTYPRITEYCKDKLAIGLSATPKYDDERNAYNFFEHEIYKEPLKEAIRNGHLAPLFAQDLLARPVTMRQKPPTDPEKLRAYLRQAELEARVNASLPKIKAAIENGKQVIIHCPAGEDIEFARNLARDLRMEYVHTKGESTLLMRNIRSYFVGGSTKQQNAEQRRAALNLFDNGQIDLLTFVNALGVGWDGPAKVLIDLVGSDSDVELLQELGRILRLMWETQGDESNPIVAEAYSFKDPRKPKRKTFCSLLGIQSGSTIKHRSGPQLDIPMPRKRPRVRVRSPEVMGTTVTVVGEMALLNEITPEIPSGSEIQQGLEMIRGKRRVDFSEAQRLLGVSPPTLKGILRQLGIKDPEGTLLDEGDIGAILQMPEFENMRARDLPDTGYMLAQDLAVELGIRVSTLNQYGWSNKLRPERLRDRNTGKIGFYYSDETKQELRRRAQTSTMLGARRS